MKVVVQVKSPMGSGNMRSQVLKYEVTHDRRLGVVRWQLLPGQGELIGPAEAFLREGHLNASEPRKG